MYMLQRLISCHNFLKVIIFACKNVNYFYKILFASDHIIYLYIWLHILIGVTVHKNKYSGKYSRTNTEHWCTTFYSSAVNYKLVEGNRN